MNTSTAQFLPDTVRISKESTLKIKKYDAAVRKLVGTSKILSLTLIVLLLAMPILWSWTIYAIIGLLISIFIITISTNTLIRKQKKVFDDEIRKAKEELNTRDITEKGKSEYEKTN